MSSVDIGVDNSCEYKQKTATINVSGRFCSVGTAKSNLPKRYKGIYYV